MKATELTDNTINAAHCDWVIHQAKVLKLLLGHNSKQMIVLNRTRALASIETAINSLNELKLFIEEVDESKEMTPERTTELLNKLIDQMVEDEGMKPHAVIERLLDIGFTADELIELKFSADEVLDLATGYAAENE